MPSVEGAHVIAGLTEEERRLSAGDEPTINPNPTPAPELREEIHVPLRVTVPDNAHELLGKLDQARDALAAQFDDGDITAKEYRDAMDRIAAEREGLEWQFRKADLAREMKDTAEKEAWAKEVNDFMTTGPGAAIAQSNAQMIAFDNIVRSVTADPSVQHLSDRAQLQKAWQIYQQDMARAGLGDGFEVAQSLGSLGNAGSYSDQFAVLDRMATNGDVAGIERALARMTPEQRDRYGY